MPHLVCYRAEPPDDTDGDGLAYELVSVERLKDEDGVAMRHGTVLPTRPPKLPPVVEAHDQIFRDPACCETARRPRLVSVVGVRASSVPDAAAATHVVATPEGREPVRAKSAPPPPPKVVPRKPVYLDDVSDLADDDDAEDGEDGGDDNDSLFVPDSVADEPPKAPKRKRGSIHVSDASSSKADASHLKSQDGRKRPKKSPPGDGQEEVTEPVLLPPDSERVRHLLSLGWRRWKVKKRKSNGLYERPPGRAVKGFEFDPASGLLKPLEAPIEARDPPDARQEVNRREEGPSPSPVFGWSDETAPTEPIMELVEKIKKELDRPCSQEDGVRLLRALDGIDMDFVTLVSTRVSDSVLRIIDKPGLQGLARPLWEKWKATYKPVERQFKGLLVRWRSAIERHDGDQVRRSVEDFVTCLEEHCHGRLTYDQTEKWDLRGLMIRSRRFHRESPAAAFKELHRIIRESLY
jgi:hypothetical protein